MPLRWSPNIPTRKAANGDNGVKGSATKAATTHAKELIDPATPKSGLNPTISSQAQNPKLSGATGDAPAVREVKVEAEKAKGPEKSTKVLDGGASPRRHFLHSTLYNPLSRSNNSFFKEEMSQYNHSSSYNRTFERKVTEQGSGAAGEAPMQGSGLRTGEFLSSPLHTIRQTMSGFPTGGSLGGLVGSGMLNPHNYHFGTTASSGAYHANDESLRVVMDVSAFAADDLRVSVVGNQIVVVGGHGPKDDELGSIERHFVRKYQLPRLAPAESVSSNLTADGQLTITAEAPKPKDNSPARTIPIKIVGGGGPSAGPPSNGSGNAAQNGSN